MKLKRFVRIRPLIPGESLPSIRRALMLRNYHESLAIHDTYAKSVLISKGIKDNFDCPNHRETYEVLAQMGNFTPLELFNASAHRFVNYLTPLKPTLSREKPARVLEMGDGYSFPLLTPQSRIQNTRSPEHAQICPQCINEGKFHRTIWLPVAVSACVTHKCLLISSCTRCKSPITIQCAVENLCPNCGRAISDLLPISLENDDVGLRSQTNIQAWLENRIEHELGANLHTASTQTLFRFVDGIRHVLILAGSQFPALYKPPFDVIRFQTNTSLNYQLLPNQSYTIFATGYEMLMDWPNKFYRFLDTYHEFLNDAGTRITMQSFGVFDSEWMKKRWNKPEFGFVRSAFEEYCSKNSIHMKRKIYGNAEAEITQIYVWKKEAATLLECDPLSIDDLVANGTLMAHKIKQKSGLAVTVFKKEDVIALKNHATQALSVRDFAQKLGLDQATVRKLVSSNVLFPQKPISKRGTRGKISNEDIDRLLDRLSTHITVKKTRPNKALTIQKAAFRFRTWEMGVEVVLRSVLDGKLNVFCASQDVQSLRDVWFLEDDLSHLVDEVLLDKGWIMLKSAAKVLGVIPKTLRYWCDLGLLIPIWSQGSKSCYKLHDITEFRNRYATFSDVQQLLDITRGKLDYLIRKGRLNPITGPKIDGRGKYLFDRQKLGDLNDTSI